MYLPIDSNNGYKVDQDLLIYRCGYLTYERGYPKIRRKKKKEKSQTNKEEILTKKKSSDLDIDNFKPIIRILVNA